MAPKRRKNTAQIHASASRKLGASAEGRETAQQREITEAVPQEQPLRRYSSRKIKPPDRFSPSTFAAQPINQKQPQIKPRGRPRKFAPSGPATVPVAPATKTPKAKGAKQKNQKGHREPSSSRQVLLAPVSTGGAPVSVENYVQESTVRDLRTLRLHTKQQVRPLLNRIRDALDPESPNLEEALTDTEALAAAFKSFGVKARRRVSAMANTNAQNTQEGSDASKKTQSRLTESILKRCNVITTAEEDRDKTVVNEIESAPALNLPDAVVMEHNWRKDLEKSSFQGESHFAAAIMLKTINRHGFSEFESKLDYSKNAKWKSRHPLAKPTNGKLIFPSSPQPDLIVGFRPKVIWEERWAEAQMMPPELMSYMIPERNEGTEDKGRAFPFLMMEVKGPSSDLQNKRGKMQTINDASHALYNIWQYMRGDETLEKEYFKNVRVFTVGAHYDLFWIRIHRAGPLPPGNPWRIREDYPLIFMHEELLTLQGERYTRGRVQGVIEKIMSWAVGNMLPLLKRGLIHTLDHAKNPQAEEGQSQISASHPTQSGQASTNQPEEDSSSTPRQPMSEVVESPQNDRVPSTRGAPSPDRQPGKKKKKGNTKVRSSATNQNEGDHTGNTQPMESSSLNDS